MGRRRARQRGPAGGVPIAGVLVLTTQVPCGFHSYSILYCRRNPRRDPTVPSCQAANPPGCLMSDPRHIALAGGIEQYYR